jgi:hypothetical protein
MHRANLPDGSLARRAFCAALVLCTLAVLPRCGPATGEAREPVPSTPDAAPEPDADAGTANPADAPPAEPDAVPVEVGPLPGPPGADPPGFEVYEPLPECLALARVLWKVEGPLTPDVLREGADQALREIATCLAAAVPGGRLPMHLILAASGRVVEVGAPLADAGMREAITCAQSALRMLRFPAAEGETTLRLVVER